MRAVVPGAHDHIIMGANGFWQYVGRLPGIHTPVSSSARCIVYDHIRQKVYLSTDDPQLAKDITRVQRLRDRGGDYRTYQLDGDDWREIGMQLRRSPARIAASPPPLFLLWWCNAWTTVAFSFLL